MKLKFAGIERKNTLYNGTPYTLSGGEVGTSIGTNSTHTHHLIQFSFGLVWVSVKELKKKKFLFLWVDYVAKNKNAE